MSKTTNRGLTPVGEKRPGWTTLRVTMDVQTKRTAERLTREYSQDLATVLAAFAYDLAEAAQRPGCWEAERVGAWLTSHPWPRPKREGGVWR